MSEDYTTKTWFNDITNDTSYAIQYERAIEILYNECVAGGKIDSLILPTLFLIRHCLELRLKYNIKFFSEYSKKNDFLKKLNSSHSLKELFNAFCVHITAAMEELGYKNQDNTSLAIHIQIHKSKIIIDLLEPLDKDGTTFRYANDKEGMRHLKKENNFDIKVLKDNLEECFKLLCHIEDVLSDGIQYYDYVTSEIES